jgi:hypothetical protein
MMGIACINRGGLIACANPFVEHDQPGTQEGDWRAECLSKHQSAKDIQGHCSLYLMPDGLRICTYAVTTTTL